MRTIKPLYRAVAAIAVSQCLFSANAQTNTLYFMKWNPQQHQLNPAFHPEGKFYIGMPALSSLNFNVGNNNLVFSDIFQNVTVDGQKKTVLFFDKNANNGSIDNFLDAMGDNTRIFYDHRINLIDFGFKVGRGFATFNITNRAQTNVLLPKALPNLVFRGIEEGEEFKMKGEDLALDVTAFTEFGLGYSRAINDKLNVGAKLKFLYGHGNVHTNFSDITITGNENLWELKGNGDIYASCPGIEIHEDENSKIDSVSFDEDIEPTEFTKPQGTGFAIDLGATYKVLPQLTVSASVLDLGFVHWKKNLHKLNKKGDFVWDGINYDINNDTIDYGEKYQDMVDEMFGVDHNPDSYTTWLNTKFMLGGEYTFWNDRLGLGLLAKGQFYRGKLYGNGTASVNFRPWKQLSATVAYGLFDGEWNNLGAGLNLNAGPINLYCAVDNIPFKFAKSEGVLIPSNTENIQLSLGMNLYFGYRQKKQKEQEEIKAEDEITPAPVLVEVKDTVPEQVVAVNNIVKTDTIVSLADNVVETEVNNNTEIAKVEEQPVAPAKSKEISESLKNLQKEASLNIKFLNYKNHLIAIDPSSYPVLDKIANEMNADTDVNVTVECHSYIINDKEFTYWMTEERANLIRGYFVEKGIDANRITTVGMGADKPLVKGKSESANRANSRTNLLFSK